MFWRLQSFYLLDNILRCQILRMFCAISRTANTTYSPSCSLYPTLQKTIHINYCGLWVIGAHILRVQDAGKCCFAPLMMSAGKSYPYRTKVAKKGSVGFS